MPVCPVRREAFRVAYELAESRARPETDKQMDMVSQDPHRQHPDSAPLSSLGDRRPHVGLRFPVDAADPSPRMPRDVSVQLECSMTRHMRQTLTPRLSAGLTKNLQRQPQYRLQHQPQHRLQQRPQKARRCPLTLPTPSPCPASPTKHPTARYVGLPHQLFPIPSSASLARVPRPQDRYRLPTSSPAPPHDRSR